MKADVSQNVTLYARTGAAIHPKSIVNFKRFINETLRK